METYINVVGAIIVTTGCLFMLMILPVVAYLAFKVIRDDY